MRDERPSTLVWIAFGFSIITLAGSLWLSVGMNLKACPLCFYQRTFVMGVVAVIAMGLFTRVRPTSLLSLVSLPMSAGALVVAGYHVGLELGGRLECPRGLLGIGTAPQQSLAALAILFVALCADVIRHRDAVRGAAMPIVASLVIGTALAWAAIKGAPSVPGPATTPYDSAPDTCRPPYEPDQPS